MTLSLDIANLARLYAAGETTPEAVVREVYSRIRKKGVAPDWISLVDEDVAALGVPCGVPEVGPGSLTSGDRWLGMIPACRCGCCTWSFVRCSGWSC